MFPGETLKKQSSPILKGDPLELNDSESVLEEDMAKYVSMIGTAQWLVTLGRFDISITVSTLSSYRVAPQKGYLECMKRLYGYVKHFPMLQYVVVQTYPTTVKWNTNPMNGYTLFMEILKKTCP